jgi:phage terminase Nu1 subunit (DNA packaging protein)
MTVVSKAEFSRHIGVSRPAVTKMIKAGRIQERDDGKINLEEAVVAYESTRQIGREASKDNGRKAGVNKSEGEKRAPGKKTTNKPAKQEQETQPAESGSISASGATNQALMQQLNRAKLAEKTFQAKLKEMEYKKATGELLEIAEVRADARKIAEDIRGKLMSIPQKLAQQIVNKSPREAQRMLEESINKALTALQDSRFTKE